MTPMTPPIPPGACDCHVHVYEPGFAAAPTATFALPVAPLADYRRVQQALGLQRVVLVQPTGYGADNRCLVQALASLDGSGRGVAVVSPEVTDAELQALHDAGVRGVRFMMIPGSGGLLPWEALEPMASRLLPWGWTINLQLDGRTLSEVAPRLQRLPGKLVIDHTGKFLEPVPPSDPAFRSLLALLDAPGRWVKLSAPYETSRLGPPAYGDVGALAVALLCAHPDRCLWASNWPHPNRHPRPADADLLALLAAWCAESGGDAALFARVLGANAAAAFDFPWPAPSA
jgi:D-galactarolactone isomerase